MGAPNQPPGERTQTFAPQKTQYGQPQYGQPAPGQRPPVGYSSALPPPLEQPSKKPIWILATILAPFNHPDVTKRAKPA